MPPFLEACNALFLHFCIALLSAYIGASASLASGITHILSLTSIETPQHTALPQPSEADTPLPVLPSHYTHAGRIPRVLLENAAYQQAAVGDALPTHPPSPAHIEEALVNIFCTYKEGDVLHATTGSGVFIDPKGIILTNAHVAQFLLLRETHPDAHCVVRQGNPATEKYTADLLYISPAWVHENAHLISSKSPSGTGERDYALLYVTEGITDAKPKIFPFLPYATSFVTRRTLPSFVSAAGYPAQIFGEEGPRAKLLPRIATTTISEVFTFSQNTADVIALHDSVIGEQGSSGGPVISPRGEVIGLIVTRGSAQDGAHSLRAITLPYINQTILEETGFNLSATLTGNIPRRSKIFTEALIPFLASLLEAEM